MEISPAESKGTNLSISIVRVTDLADIPILAKICGSALAEDKFSDLIAKYTGSTFEEESLERLAMAVQNPDKHFVFKAVLKPNDEQSGEVKEEIVGVSQWYVGYVDIPKYDPFAPKDESSDEKKEARYPNLNPFQDFVRKSMNSYISAIRGKKYVHLRRLFVHPDYQRQGIGRALLQWGIDVADRESLVCWLTARQLSFRLYEQAGWRIHTVIEINEPDLIIPPVLCMMRPRKD